MWMEGIGGVGIKGCEMVAAKVTGGIEGCRLLLSTIPIRLLIPLVAPSEEGEKPVRIHAH